LANRIIQDLEDVAKVEKPPKKEGRNMLFTLVPKNK
ncbi:MAG: translation initiation factor IF-3 C-terminal domain-containing protein, partial [Aquificae bacterium]|nr:translation initiation factor IF-3 C-terminal domain-containing protein [Aquificota bacterium]